MAGVTHSAYFFGAGSYDMYIVKFDNNDNACCAAVAGGTVSSGGTVGSGGMLNTVCQ